MTLELVAFRAADPTAFHFPSMIEALDATHSVTVVQEMLGQAEGIEKYFRRQKFCGDRQNQAAELKFRCQRKLGILLKAAVRHQGGRPGAGNGNGPLPFSGRLPEGISKIQSSRWQELAAIPDVYFERWLSKTAEINEATGEPTERTRTGLVAFAKAAIFEAEQQLEPAPGGADDSSEADDADEPTNIGQHIVVTRLYHNLESHRAFLALLAKGMAYYGTDNPTDTIDAVLASMEDSGA